MCWTRSNEVPSSSWYSSSTPSVYGSLCPNVWSSTLAREPGVPELPLPVMSAGISCLRHPITASASISTFQDGSSNDVTTQVAAGRRLAEDLAVGARHVRPVRAIGDEHPRAHDVVDRGAARSSASAMIARQSRACS